MPQVERQRRFKVVSSEPEANLGSGSFEETIRLLERELAAARRESRELRLELARRDPAVERARRLERATAAWGLTGRQVEVLALVAQGLCNKEIAARLVCADNTVEAHLSAIFRKSASESRAALIARFWSEL